MALRVVRECYIPNVWYTRHDNGTEWLGETSSLLKELQRTFPPLQVISKLSQSNVTIPSIQTVADGRADFDADRYGVTWNRFQLVDFSYPIGTSEIYIYSTRRTKISGQVLVGTFDIPSLIFIVMSIVAMALTLGVLRTFDKAMTAGSKWDLSLIFINTFGSFVEQPFPTSFLNFKTVAASMFCVFIRVASFFITIMYGCIVISMLTAKVDVDSINSLEDLVKKFPDKRVLVPELSFMEQIVKGDRLYPQLQDRVVPFNENQEPQALMQVLDSVLEGTHVLITASENLVSMRLKLPREDQCRYPAESFRKSNQPLATAWVAWILRKKLPWSEMINRTLMKLAENGLSDSFKAGKGLFSPDQMDEDCELAKLYFKDETQCLTSSYQQGAMPLGLVHIYRIFIFFGLGMALATLVFAIELISTFYAT